MTDAESRLWSKLRMKQLKGLQFYRQKIIGEYIVDFYCPSTRLVLEIDGGQHYGDDGIKNDEKRDDYLLTHGLKVLRFSNADIFENLNGVLEKIYENI